MKWLKKLLGVGSVASVAAAQPVATPSTVAAPPAAVSDPAKDPNMIRVHDAYGREMFITKQEWRDSVLLGHIQKVWNDPDELAAVITQSLQDGFGADMVKPAEQLAKIDPNAERGAVLLAVTYLDQKRPTDAAKVIQSFIKTHGPSGVALTNLAKAQSALGAEETSLKTLWSALEIDPNQDNGLQWYALRCRDRDGEAAYFDAYRRVAAVPGAWRPQMWLARDALDRRALDEALTLYHEALERAPRPVPTDLLMQLSGDLGNHAHLPELLELTTPHFDVTVHGITVGNNLIKARLDLGQIDAAQALVESLYTQQRPDWKPTLTFWDNEIAQARITAADTHAASSSPTGEPKVSISIRSSDGPVWLAQGSPAAELYGSATPPDENLPRIAFIGSSATQPQTGERAKLQLADNMGRVARGLPLYLAERTQFGARATVTSLVPWLEGDTPSFVLSGGPWSAETAAEQARRGDHPADYVVIQHLDASQPQWRVQLDLVRTIDARELATLSAEFPIHDPGAALNRLATDLLSALATHAEVTPAEPPAVYQPATDANLATYIVRLEQLLSIRAAQTLPRKHRFLHGERDIIDGMVQYCLAAPTDVTARLLLIEALRRLKEVHPEVVTQAHPTIEHLQKDKPLTGEAAAVITGMLAEIYPQN